MPGEPDRSAGTDGAEYCPHCGRTVEVSVTVPWQANICTSCGNDIPE